MKILSFLASFLLFATSCTDNSADPIFIPHAVSGRITLDNAGLSGVLLKDSEGRRTLSVTNGNFVFPIVNNGTYKITPFKAGFLFYPPSTTVSVKNANVTDLNFQASSDPSPSKNLILCGASAKTWKYSGIYRNGKTNTFDTTLRVTFYADGRFFYKNSSWNETGTWKFEDEETMLSYKLAQVDAIYEILKLTETELRLRQITAFDSWEYAYTTE